MSENTKPISNEAENGNKSKPMCVAGWIRFLDELPPFEEEIIIAYSSSPYNGMSFLALGKCISKDIVILKGRNFNLEVYNYDGFGKKWHVAYAHHWAFNTSENKKLDIKKICEYDRLKRGENFPVKC